MSGLATTHASSSGAGRGNGDGRRSNGRPEQKTHGRQAPHELAARGGPGPLPKVALFCDQQLTREALRAAITSRGVEVLDLSFPRARPELRAAMHEVEPFGAQVGLVVQERFDPFLIRDTQRLIQKGQGLTWVVLTSCAPGPYWSALLMAGADGVLRVDIGVDALVGMLPDMAEGTAVMDPADRQWLRRHDAGQRQSVERLAQLSPREVEVLKLLANGHGVAEVAVLQEVSEDTVRSHVRAVLRKLKVSSQLAAVAEWERATRGWPAARSW